jgi:hypothetical protein
MTWSWGSRSTSSCPTETGSGAWRSGSSSSGPSPWGRLADGRFTHRYHRRHGAHTPGGAGCRGPALSPAALHGGTPGQGGPLSPGEGAFRLGAHPFPPPRRTRAELPRGAHPGGAPGSRATGHRRSAPRRRSSLGAPRGGADGRPGARGALHALPGGHRLRGGPVRRESLWISPGWKPASASPTAFSGGPARRPRNSLPRTPEGGGSDGRGGGGRVPVQAGPSGGGREDHSRRSANPLDCG